MAPSTVRGKVIADVLAVLDASEIDASWSDVPEDPNYGGGTADGNAWVAWNVDLAATEVAAIVLETEGHPSRGDLMTLSDPLTHGQKLPPHIGEHGPVQVSPDGTAGAYVPAYERSLEAVLTKKASSRTLGRENYFIDTADVIWFSAKSASARAKVWLGNVTIGSPTSLENYPAELLNAVAARALSKLFPQGGDRVGPARHFAGEWAAARAAILRKQVPEPPNPMPAEAA